jgi:hypothetical protein
MLTAFGHSLCASESALTVATASQHERRMVERQERSLRASRGAVAHA